MHVISLHCGLGGLRDFRVVTARNAFRFSLRPKLRIFQKGRNSEGKKPTVRNGTIAI